MALGDGKSTWPTLWPLIFNIGAVGFFVLAAWLLIKDQNAAARPMIALAGAGLSAMLANLDKIESVKASLSGIEAKTRRAAEVVREAEGAIERLRSLAAVIAAPLFTVSMRMGRWGTHLSRRERLELVERVEAELKQVGVPQVLIGEAKEEFHRYATLDLFRTVAGVLREIVNEKAEARQKAMEAVPQPISNHTEYGILFAALQEANGELAKLTAIDKVPRKESYSWFQEYLRNCPLFNEAERSDFTMANAEAIEDLRAYAEHERFRRLNVWLETPDS